ncbi:MAG: cytochrome P450, partial [Ectothiorhodospiraceae bacterium]|nr:cytochrome P450 [Ectothiorhodospiraceae bacterium]
MKDELYPIPGPARRPFVGNLLQIPRGRMSAHMLALSRQYDGIFELDFGGICVPFVSSAALAEELCDEARFRKVIRPPLSLLRKVVGDGLFTAHSNQQPWGKAHRVLMPAFSQRAMKSYFGAMLEVAEQLSASWDRRTGEDILVADDMTRLTLDTISLAGFGYRFNSFDKAELHPFLGAMVRVLSHTMSKLTRLPLLNRISKDSPEFLGDIEQMNQLVDEVIRSRRERPAGTGDLLDLMLHAEDPDTGERLDDVNIRHQVLTFLVAGHETTSGLLTFAIYLLLRHPHVLAQAYTEVDQVLPDETVPEYRHLAQLNVIERILKETLRLWPTAPAITVAPYEDTVIGGRYRIRKDQTVNIQLPALHRDPAVWQEPDSFDIDRFLPEREARIHPHAYKPFGNGERACIGRQFALTEAKLALAMVLQRFALSDPYDYRLDIKETLTLKPDNFRIHVKRRAPHERMRPATPPTPEHTPL